ncbi:MAG: NAD(P)-dependent oxidoreductase [bacterium]|nr:NAD(P)-dependent oxidoreductase [bacterium]
MKTLKPHKNKNVLITGAAGFIGSHLALRLLNGGFKVTVLAIDTSKLKDEIFKNATVVEGHLDNIDVARKAVYGIDIIINLAGNVHTWDTWENYFNSNILTVQTLLKAISENNSDTKRLLHFSTVDVYGYTDQECSEKDVMIEKYGYGTSKSIGEKYITENCTKLNIPFTIFRPTNVIGPGSQFIKEIGTHIKEGKMMAVNGGKADGGFIYVDNLIDYVLWSVESETAINEIYNLSENNNKTWKDFLDTLKTEINPKASIISMPYRIALVPALIFEFIAKLFKLKNEPLIHRLLLDMFGKTCNHSAEKIRKHSNIQPSVSFDEGIKKSINWFLNNT